MNRREFLQMAGMGLVSSLGVPRLMSAAETPREFGSFR